MKIRMKRLAVLITVILLFGCLHLTAWAASPGVFHVQYINDWEGSSSESDRMLSFTSAGESFTLGTYLDSTPSNSDGLVYAQTILYKIAVKNAPSWITIDSSEDLTYPENAGKITADVSQLTAETTATVTATAYYYWMSNGNTDDAVEADFTFTVRGTPENSGSGNKIDYTVHYKDASGNAVADDQTGSATVNTYVNLAPANMKSNYHINSTQAAIAGYPETWPAWFKYGSPSQVYISPDFYEYTVVCGYTSQSGSNNSSSGGSSTASSQTVKQGWIYENNVWYYYSGTTRSTLKKGWHHDPQDGYWYYLDLSNGAMFTDWHEIGGKWYYFNPYTPQWTWEKHDDGEWYYKGISGARPLGSMYSNEKTPDGLTVNEDGEWIK